MLIYVRQTEHESVMQLPSEGDGMDENFSEVPQDLRTFF